MVIGLPADRSHSASRLIKSVELRVATTYGLRFILTFLVISIAVVMFVNPALAVTRGNTIDTSNDHATVTSTSSTPTISNTETNPSATVGTPTIQAPLQIPRTLQSTDLVNSLAFYEVTFITSTMGAIDKIRMDFPAGTGVGAAGIIERVGIGGGTLLKSGSSITYDVTSPVSIPAGTFIRLEMFGIKNPITPSTTFTADITTRDSGGGLIDGPSPTNVYTIKKIVSSDIADGAVTDSKVSPSFIRSRVLLDGQNNWTPDGAATSFHINDPTITANSHIFVGTTDISGVNNVVCGDEGFISGTGFDLVCTTPPSDGAAVKYTVIEQPSI